VGSERNGDPKGLGLEIGVNEPTQEGGLRDFLQPPGEAGVNGVGNTISTYLATERK